MNCFIFFGWWFVVIVFVGLNLWLVFVVVGLLFDMI